MNIMGKGGVSELNKVCKKRERKDNDCGEEQGEMSVAWQNYVNYLEWDRMYDKVRNKLSKDLKLGTYEICKQQKAIGPNKVAEKKLLLIYIKKTPFNARLSSNVWSERSCQQS